MTSTDTPRGLTAAQLELLLQPISPSRVREHKGQSHVEAWDVRRWLTRIFGFGGWSDEILSCQCVHEVMWPVMEKGEPVPGKHRCTAVYRVTLRLTVRDEHGNEIGHWDDGATGDGINQVSVGDAHDLALKTAMSQALKRCAVNLGDQFGLSLYNKGSNAPAVVRTVAHSMVPRPPGAEEQQQDAPVQGGELDEERTGPEDTPAPAARTTPRERLVKPKGEDPWQQEAPPAEEPNHPTLRMLSALATLATKKRGIGNNREQRLELMRSFLPEKRRAQIRSGKDLFFDEASRIIGLLEKEKDFTPPAPDPEPYVPVPTLGELLESNTAADGVFEQLKRLIREASSDAAMEALIHLAIEAGEAKHITHGQYDALCEIGRQRSEAMHADPGWSARGVASMAGA